MKIHDIVEARRNPKHPAQIKTRKSNMRQLSPYLNSDDIFGSFTLLPKVGINPKQAWNTPIGIYTYPLKQYKEAIYSEGVRGAFPFASDNPYFMILKPTTPVLDIANLQEPEFNRYVEKLETMYSQYDEEDYIGFYRDEQMDSYGSRLWSLTRELSLKLAKQKNKNPQVQWNTVLRSIGIKAIADYDGEGIIHDNEPIQAVFLTKDSVELIEKIKLKYSKDEIAENPDLFFNIPTDDPKIYDYMYLILIRSYGDIASDLRIEGYTIPDKVLLKLLKNDPSTFYNTVDYYGPDKIKLSKPVIIQALTTMPTDMLQLLSRTITMDKILDDEELQMVALKQLIAIEDKVTVRTDGKNVDDFIKVFTSNPSEKVEVMARKYLMGVE